MAEIKMIVTDLDGTLLRKDKTVSGYTESVFQSCRDKGIKIVFATARPERATRHLQAGVPVSHVIANNGANIVSRGEIIHNIPIPENIKNGLISRLTGCEGITGITVETGDFLYTNDRNHTNWSLGADWNPVYTDFSVPIKEETVKISVECGDRGAVLDIVGDYPEILHLLPNSGENWHQITHRDAGKLNAVIFLSKLDGIALKNIIAFGDDYNDIEMLESCGAGVAVGNAIDEVKRAAGYICGANDDDGVAKYLERYVLNKG